MTDVLTGRLPRAVSPAAPPRRRLRPTVRGPRRSDIEGLRALAVLGVLAFHAGLPFVPGGYVGVDVFFVISGFLITGLVATELKETGRVSFARFYARRIKRLLPSAVLVLVVTAAASAVILSPLARGRAGGDIMSAALYFSNWHFAAQQTDYLAADSSPSPVLHFWSLSVEEQYYVLWPLVLVAAVWWARRRQMLVGRSVLAAVLGIGLVSLAWSLLWTASNPVFAFFGTMTRAWELALGGLLALTAGLLARTPALGRVVLGGIGLAAVLWSMATYTEDIPFPGTAALVPVLGAAAIIAAGMPSATGSRSRYSTDSQGVGLLLGVGPMRAIGRVSYSLYLWHWPPLVLVPVVLGSPLSPAAGTLIVLISAIPAVYAHRYIEEPFRRSTALVDFPRRAAVVAVVLTAIGAGAGFALTRASPPTAINVEVVRPDGSRQQVTVDPEGARKDNPTPYGDNCHVGYAGVVPKACVYGNTDSGGRVALFGDSHAIQWFPALLPIAQQQGWALEVDTKSACSAADVLQYASALKKVYEDCRTFREAVIQRWEDSPDVRPDVVVIASRNQLAVVEDGQRLSPTASLAAQRDGLVRTMKRLLGLGIEVVLLADTPSPGFDVPECLSAQSDRTPDCSYSLKEGRPSLQSDRAAARTAGVPVIDLSAVLCPQKVCAPVLDKVVVYRDSHHMTATFAGQLWPELQRRFESTPAWSRLNP